MTHVRGVFDDREAAEIAERRLILEAQGDAVYMHAPEASGEEVASVWDSLKRVLGSEENVVVSAEVPPDQIERARLIFTEQGALEVQERLPMERASMEPLPQVDPIDVLPPAPKEAPLNTQSYAEQLTQARFASMRISDPI